MKKSIKVLIFIVLLIFIYEVVNLILYIPFYPNYTKEVSSYEALQKSLKGLEVEFADLGDFGIYNTEYLVNLDGRTLFSDKIGYSIKGNLTVEDTIINAEITVNEVSEGVNYYDSNGVAEYTNSNNELHTLDLGKLEDSFHYYALSYYDNVNNEETISKINKELKTRLENLFR